MVFALDHDVSNKSEANLKKYAQIEEFAKTHGVEFFPAGHGIGHQVMVSSTRFFMQSETAYTLSSFFSVPI